MFLLKTTNEYFDFSMRGRIWRRFLADVKALRIIWIKQSLFLECRKIQIIILKNGKFSVLVLKDDTIQALLWVYATIQIILSDNGSISIIL